MPDIPPVDNPRGTPDADPEWTWPNLEEDGTPIVDPNGPIWHWQILTTENIQESANDLSDEVEDLIEEFGGKSPQVDELLQQKKEAIEAMEAFGEMVQSLSGNHSMAPAYLWGTSYRVWLALLEEIKQLNDKIALLLEELGLAVVNWHLRLAWGMPWIIPRWTVPEGPGRPPTIPVATPPNAPGPGKPVPVAPPPAPQPRPGGQAAPAPLTPSPPDDGFTYPGSLAPKPGGARGVLPGTVPPAAAGDEIPPVDTPPSPGQIAGGAGTGIGGPDRKDAIGIGGFPPGFRFPRRRRVTPGRTTAPLPPPRNLNPDKDLGPPPEGGFIIPPFDEPEPIPPHPGAIPPAGAGEDALLDYIERLERHLRERRRRRIDR